MTSDSDSASEEESKTFYVPASRMNLMREFYRSVLAQLDYREMVKKEGDFEIGYTLVGYGENDKNPPSFWLKAVTDEQASSPTHVSFNAPSGFSLPIQSG